MRARRRRRGVPWRSSGGLLGAVEGRGVVLVVAVVAADRVLELAHSAAERLTDLRKPLGSEYEQCDDEHDDQLTRPDVVERHGTFPFGGRFSSLPAVSLSAQDECVLGV